MRRTNCVQGDCLADDSRAQQMMHVEQKIAECAKYAIHSDSDVMQEGRCFSLFRKKEGGILFPVYCGQEYLLLAIAKELEERSLSGWISTFSTSRNDR